MTPGYFETIGIPLLAGRDFTLSDGPSAPAVMVVNEAFAEQRWPGESPLGRRLRRPATPGAPAALVEVVGVVANAKYLTVTEPLRPYVYLPLLQGYSPFGSVLVRSDGNPLALAPAVRQAIVDVDPDMAPAGAERLRALSSVTLLPIRIAGTMLGIVGGLTLVLAAVGIAGVLGCLVRQRTREIGIRIALGAAPRAIVSMVARHSLRWMGVGLALGFTGALILGRFLAGLLHEIGPTDPVSFVLTAFVFLVVGGFATLVPVRHALRTDPITALRTE